MKALRTISGVIVAIALATAPFVEYADAQGAPPPHVNNAGATLAPAEIDRIIGTMLQRESENASAKLGYAFTRDEDLKTIGFGGKVTGTFHRSSEHNLDARGAFIDRIIYFPIPTLQLSQQATAGVLAIEDFSLNTTNIGSYYVQFAGRSKLDELDTFVFDVTPKVADDRSFAGRIWVDDRDLRIVKSQGTFGALAASTRGPVFEIYREQIDGRYWFPTYIYVDGPLQTDRVSEHIRLVKKFTNYRHATAPQQAAPPIQQPAFNS